MMKAVLEKFRERIRKESNEALLETAVAQFSRAEDCEARLREFQEMHTGVVRDYKKIKDEYEKVKQERDELLKQNRHLLELTTKQTNSLFGRSSEKTDDLLCSSVREEKADIQDPVNEDAPDTAPEADKAIDPDDMAEADVRQMLRDLLGEKERKKKEKGKRDADLANLPVREDYIFDVEELDRLYGKHWRIVRWVKRRTVEHVRSANYVQHTYFPLVETETLGLKSPFYTEPLIEKSLA